MRVSQSLKLPDRVKRDEPRPATEQIQAAEALPKISYKLEVDGRLKSEYPTQEAAMAVALELKRKFPHIRVAIAVRATLKNMGFPDLAAEETV